MPLFLATKFLGLARWAWLGIAAAALIGLVWWLNAAEKADDRANQEIGATVEREKALTETIEQVKEANDAREDNRNRTDDQQRTDCLRRSRTPENC